jgi:hypothetical protein
MSLIGPKPSVGGDVRDPADLTSGKIIRVIVFRRNVGEEQSGMRLRQKRSHASRPSDARRPG